MADGTEYIVSYVSDVLPALKEIRKIETANKKMTQQFGKNAPKAVKVLGSEIQKVSKQKIIDKKGIERTIPVFRQLGTTVKTTDGQLRTLTDSQKVLKDGTVRTTSSFKKMDTNTVSLGQNIARLAKRAALTIPLWFALRQVFTGTFRTISDGIRTIAEQDRALQKAKRNIQGTTDVIETNFKRLREESLKLSLQTGESVEKIVTAFQRFATTGLDFETSMAGANGSLKTAVLLFGDTEEVANAFARAYRVLGGRSEEFTSKSEEIQSLLANISELWKDNAFEINEFNGAIERFAPTARVANVSLKETAVLLSTLQTAGIRGTRAGRLLSTAILQMEKNFDDFSSTLGINLGAVDSTFERLRLVTGAIEDLNKTNPVKASQAVSALFRIRGGQSIRALTSLNSELEDAIDKTTDINKFNNEFEEQNRQINRLKTQFTNLNREIGKAFVTGLVGGEDFRDSLEKIVHTLRNIRERAEGVGEAVTDIATLSLSGWAFIYQKYFERIEKSARSLTSDLDRITRGLLGKLGTEELRKLIAELSKIEDLEPFGGERAFQNLIEQFKKQTDDLRNRIANAFREGISKADLEGLISDVKLATPESLGLSEEDFNFILNRLNTFLEKVDSAIEEQKQKDNKIPISVNIAPEELDKVNTAIIDSYLNQLEQEGALTSEIIDRENKIEDILNIKQDEITLLERQLEKERAINEERELQNRLSSRAVKLFRIAQEEGTDIAKDIGDVLAGEADFDLFVRRGGKALEIFKKQFSDVFEQQQAQAFFRGETVPGLSGLTGGFGVTLPTDDRALRGIGGVSNVLLQRQRALRERFPAEAVSQVAPQANVNLEIATNVDISKIDEIASTVESNIIRQATTAGTKVNRALAQALTNKQVRRI